MLGLHIGPQYNNIEYLLCLETPTCGKDAACGNFWHDYILAAVMLRYSIRDVLLDSKVVGKRWPALSIALDLNCPEIEAIAMGSGEEVGAFSGKTRVKRSESGRMH